MTCCAIIGVSEPGFKPGCVVPAFTNAAEKFDTEMENVLAVYLKLVFVQVQHNLYPWLEAL